MRGLLWIAALGLGAVTVLLVGRKLLRDLEPEVQTAPPALTLEEPGRIADPAPPRGGREEGPPGTPAEEVSNPPVENPRAAALARNREALAALDAGNLREAIALLEQCCLELPEEPVFARNLAVAQATLAEELFHSPESSERDEALELLEHALPHLDGEERAALEARLARWRAQADHERDFLTAGNPRFELAYDGQFPELLAAEADLLERLDRAYQEFGERFGAFPLEQQRLRVVLYRASDFARLTGLGHWAGGVFDGTIRVPIGPSGLDPRLDGVLRHELCHAFVQRLAGGNCPAWLNEGLAQVLEDEARAGVRAAGAREALLGVQAPQLTDLTGAFVRLGDEVRIREAYRWSLAFVQGLVHDHGERVVFAMASSREASAGDVFRARLARELAAEWQRLAEAVRQH